MFHLNIMMIIDKVLNGCITAETKNYSAGDIIFSTGETPLQYYVISKGSIKLINVNDEGKEFIQEIRQEDQSIAEFTLFVDELYPFTAIAITDCVIKSFPKSDLISLTKDHPELNLYFLRKLSESIHQEFLTSDLFVSDKNTDMVTILLNYFKRKHTDMAPCSFPISLSIPEIAYLTSLPVNIVAMTIERMEKQNILRIVDHKIFC